MVTSYLEAVGVGAHLIGVVHHVDGKPQHSVLHGMEQLVASLNRLIAYHHITGHPTLPGLPPVPHRATSYGVLRQNT